MSLVIASLSIRPDVSQTRVQGDSVHAARALAALEPCSARARRSAAGAAIPDGCDEEQWNREIALIMEAFEDEVRQRKEDGWYHGRFGNAWIMLTSPPSSHSDLYAMQEQLTVFRRRLAKAQESGDAKWANYYLVEIVKLEQYVKRPMGLCTDWREAVYRRLIRLKLECFEVRKFDTDNQLHSAAGLVPKGWDKDPKKAIVLDPWVSGKPALYSFDEWKRGNYQRK
ncbi:MAG: hypothetical protein HYZ58_08850 [Acidobacteria bacterium]|nr:hypothetical protein [Acidobacteriota bacterium]MBI3263247.1 hypothetical protein [Acidobacteriota bacterium]